MIVDPDFLTHWKTRALIRTLDYEAAPLCVLALWAYCQHRRCDRFKATPAAFAAICGFPFPGQSNEFFDAMKSAGFIDVEADTIVAHDFGATNSKLAANWQNGRMGGRPLGLDKRTHKKPTNNPQITQNEKTRVGVPRLGKSRKDKERNKEVGANESHPTPAELEKEWRRKLADDPAYQHINVSAEYGKMLRWCEVNKKQPTKRRFVNWLNRIEGPLAPYSGSARSRPKILPKPEEPQASDEEREKAKKFIAGLTEDLAGKFSAGGA